jgi:hypothetical protein
MIINTRRGDLENNICRPQIFNKKILLESTLELSNACNVPMTTRDCEMRRLYCSLFASVFSDSISSLYYIASNDWVIVNNEVVRIIKEVVLA